MDTETDRLDIHQVHWPAFIKHSDNSLLTYLGELQSWNELLQHSHWLVGENDMLVDAQGRKLFIEKVSERHIALQQKGIIESAELEKLVKEHLQNTGSCCIAKIRVSNLQEAMGLIESGYEF